MAEIYDGPTMSDEGIAELEAQAFFAALQGDKDARKWLIEWEESKTVYRAEARVYNAHQLAEPFTEKLSDVKAWLDEIQAQPWFTKRYTPREITLVDGPEPWDRDRPAQGLVETQTIVLPYWARNKASVLHEFAHLLDDEARHGKQWRDHYRYLFKNVFGRKLAAELDESFKQEGIEV
jgi:hypothetical protein